jgi:hypothetical protein
MDLHLSSPLCLWYTHGLASATDYRDISPFLYILRSGAREYSIQGLGSLWEHPSKNSKTAARIIKWQALSMLFIILKKFDDSEDNCCVAWKQTYVSPALKFAGRRRTKRIGLMKMLSKRCGIRPPGGRNSWLANSQGNGLWLVGR